MDEPPSSPDAATIVGLPEHRHDDRRAFDWPVAVISVAFGCTAAWIGFVLWLIIWAAGIVIA
jgi:hypothetical protein